MVRVCEEECLRDDPMTGIVPDDLKEVCIVPICKRKGD